MGKSKKNTVDRRGFLKGAAAGAAALAVTPTMVASAAALPAGALGENANAASRVGASSASARLGVAPAKLGTARGKVPPPTMSPAAEEGTPTRLEALTMDRSGSDFMVDVIKSLGIEYICANPGSAFRGLHESFINYGGNKSPEFITCCHEESSVAMAHGYAKIEGKPAMIMAHGTVGLQHASMAIYNAWCDRAPVYIVVGNILDATKRISEVEWVHSVQDAAAMVRDYTKWDDTPISLPHFAESAVRAYKIAMTPPSLPVVLVADGELQENPIATDAKLRVPKLELAAPPAGDPGAVAEAARMLVNAENPVIITERMARTPAGMKRLVELAEALQASVIDRGARMNFPSRHPLNQTERSGAVIRGADVLLGIEVTDFFDVVNDFRDQIDRESTPIYRQGAKFIAITAADLYSKGNYQDFQRMQDADLAIAADGEATLPELTEAVKKLLTGDKKRALQDRGAKLATAHQEALARNREAATYGWDASPISTARLCAEIYGQIKNEDWSLVSATTFVNRWPQKLWDFNKPYHYIGAAGGYGVGYGSPAAVGAALANKKYGRLSVNIQNDGDMMYAPGVLWTAAHHQIPMLTVMHNNRAYHQEVMQVQIMADRHSRGIDRAWIGTTMKDPAIDFAKLAQSLGVHGEGPISDPNELGPAIKRALAVVKSGQPALVDVLTQPR